MILYHFTGWSGLLGRAGFDAMKAVPGDEADLCAIAEPGSILKDGLQPRQDGDWCGILPVPVVWLTANPNMPFGFSSFHDWRVTVVVPSNRRLRRWSTFLCKRRIDPSPPGVPEFSRREGEQF